MIGGVPAGINVYAYAGDDPVDLSDPTGLCTSATYDGPSEAGEASEAGGSSIGTAASYAIAGDFAAINGGGVSIGIGIGGIGGPGSLRSGLLPDHGGAYPGGDIVLAYQGQNGGGIWLAQEFRRPPSTQPGGLPAFSACAAAFMAFNPELVAACAVTLGACSSGAGAVLCGSAGVTCGLWASALGLCYRGAYGMAVPPPSPEYNVPSP